MPRASRRRTANRHQRTAIAGSSCPSRAGRQAQCCAYCSALLRRGAHFELVLPVGADLDERGPAAGRFAVLKDLKAGKHDSRLDTKRQRPAARRFAGLRHHRLDRRVGEPQPLSDLRAELVERLVRKGRRAPRLQGQGALTIQIEHRTTPKVAQDLPRAGALQLGVCGDREVGLGHGIIFFQEPAHQPADCRRAAGPCEAVLLVRLEKIHALAEPEAAVNQLDLTERVPAPPDIEIIAGSDREQSRLGARIAA